MSTWQALIFQYERAFSIGKGDTLQGSTHEGEWTPLPP